MNAQVKPTSGSPLNVYRKLSLARQKFHALELKKSGRNTFANYSYFELGDFLLPALAIFDEIGLGTTPVTFDGEFARMDIVDLDKPEDRIELCSPMGSAALKGCHEVQNIGAVETYQRRYLWVNALEIVEHDALDASTGKSAPQREEAPASMPAEVRNRIIQLCEAVGGNQSGQICKAYGVEAITDLSQQQSEAVISRLNEKLAAKAKADTDEKAKEPA